MPGLWPCRNNRKAAKYAAARAIAEERRIAMPTETAITVAGIIIAFAVFAVSLAWADTTRGMFAHRVQCIFARLNRVGLCEPR